MPALSATSAGISGFFWRKLKEGTSKEPVFPSVPFRFQSVFQPPSSYSRYETGAFPYYRAVRIERKTAGASRPQRKNVLYKSRGRLGDVMPGSLA